MKWYRCHLPLCTWCIALTSREGGGGTWRVCWNIFLVDIGGGGSRRLRHFRRTVLLNQSASAVTNEPCNLEFYSSLHNELLPYLPSPRFSRSHCVTQIINGRSYRALPYLLRYTLTLRVRSADSRVKSRFFTSRVILVENASTDPTVREILYLRVSSWLTHARRHAFEIRDWRRVYANTPFHFRAGHARKQNIRDARSDLTFPRLSLWMCRRYKTFRQATVPSRYTKFISFSYIFFLLFTYDETLPNIRHAI